MNVRPGRTFLDADVARCYVHRPDYPDGVFDTLRALSPAPGSLLDLGCGTGRIARALAGDFSRVTALDASHEMLEVGRRQPGGEAENIRWVEGAAESAHLLGAPFDLVVAAASIHWMDHGVLFPRLLGAMSDAYLFAVVDGDGAWNPPWQADWEAFLGDWIPRITGEPYEPHSPHSTFRRRMERHRAWVDAAGETSFVSAPVRQAVTDFIAGQHSRDTFAPSRLGSLLAEFDAGLLELLDPFSSDGMLTFSVRTEITWGTIRTGPAPARGDADR